MPKPSKQITDRKIISDAQLKHEIFKQFAKGNTGKTDLYGLLRTNFKLGRDRYFNSYDVALSDWAKLKDKAEGEGIISKTIEAAKNGLKSKIEKQFEIQKEIEIIDKQIKGEVQFSFILGSKVMNSHNGDKFMLPVQVQNDLRKRKLEYYAELNKMDGDYAPAKVARTDTDGNDITDVIFVDFTKAQ